MSRIESANPDWAARLREDGYAFVPAAAFRTYVEARASLADWNAFASSWKRLEPDTYLAAVGRQRRRRHAVYTADREGPARLAPRQPHVQTLEYNTLQGGIERWFEPIEPTIATGASLQALIASGRDLFRHHFDWAGAWRIEAHQFRIEPTTDAPGEPTPEGAHRDGVDGVLVVLIDRCNVREGETSTLSLDGRRLGAFTLAEPLDVALVDDARVLHGVTAVEPLDPLGERAHRDVLVLTYQRADAERAAD